MGGDPPWGGGARRDRLHYGKGDALCPLSSQPRRHHNSDASRQHHPRNIHTRNIDVTSQNHRDTSDDNPSGDDSGHDHHALDDLVDDNHGADGVANDDLARPDAELAEPAMDAQAKIVLEPLGAKLVVGNGADDDVRSRIEGVEIHLALTLGGDF